MQWCISHHMLLGLAPKWGISKKNSSYFITVILLQVVPFQNASTVTLWSDRCHHFHSGLILNHYSEFENVFSIKIKANFFEAGEGKNDIDAHCGNLSNLEHSYLIKHEVIRGNIYQQQ